MDASSLIEQLAAPFPGVVFEPVASVDFPTIVVPRDHLVDVARWLRDSPGLEFRFLSDLTCVDYWPREPRFEVVYHLVRLGVPGFPRPASAAPPQRVRLLVRLHGDDAHVPTLSGVFRAADWAEREVYDLFGVLFDDHPDLRRILMPDDWEGHPLRKDYPVQVNVPVKAAEPLQLSEEEFIANMERLRVHRSRQRSDRA